MSYNRLQDKDIQLLNSDLVGVDFGEYPGDSLEFHVYDTSDSYITSNHDIKKWNRPQRS